MILYFLFLLIEAFLLTFSTPPRVVIVTSPGVLQNKKPPVVKPNLMLRSYSDFYLGHSSTTIKYNIPDPEDYYEYDYSDSEDRDPKPVQKQISRKEDPTQKTYTPEELSQINFNSYSDPVVASRLEKEYVQVSRELTDLEKKINSIYGKKHLVPRFSYLFRRRIDILDELERMRPPLPPLKDMYPDGMVGFGKLREDIEKRISGPFGIARKQSLSDYR